MENIFVFMVGATSGRPHLSCPSNTPLAAILDLQLVRQSKKLIHRTCRGRRPRRPDISRPLNY